jgi:hypothetical protein
VIAQPIREELEQFAGGSRIAGFDAFSQRLRPLARGVVLLLVPRKSSVMHGAHETLFVAKVLVRRFQQVRQDRFQLGRFSARQQGLVQFVPEPINRTVLGVDLRQVNRVGTTPLKETHGHYCTQFKI